MFTSRRCALIVTIGRVPARRLAGSHCRKPALNVPVMVKAQMIGAREEFWRNPVVRQRDRASWLNLLSSAVSSYVRKYYTAQIGDVRATNSVAIYKTLDSRMSMLKGLLFQQHHSILYDRSNTHYRRKQTEVGGSTGPN